MCGSAKSEQWARSTKMQTAEWWASHTERTSSTQSWPGPHKVLPFPPVLHRVTWAHSWFRTDCARSTQMQSDGPVPHSVCPVHSEWALGPYHTGPNRVGLGPSPHRVWARSKQWTHSHMTQRRSVPQKSDFIPHRVTWARSVQSSK